MLWRINCIERKYTQPGIEVKPFVRMVEAALLAVVLNMGFRCGDCAGGFFIFSLTLRRINGKVDYFWRSAKKRSRVLTPEMFSGFELGDVAVLRLYG